MPIDDPPQPFRPHDGLPAPSFAEEVYQHLRLAAERQLVGEHAGHTLQPTALVHEAWLRLCKDRKVPFQNRAHYYAAAAEAMRRVLLDHAKARHRHKRGGAAQRVTLTGLDLPSRHGDFDVVAFDDAFRRLTEETPDVAEIVRLRVYAGLSVAETAQALSVSTRTVDREWTYARARLYRLLAND